MNKVHRPLYLDKDLIILHTEAGYDLWVDGTRLPERVDYGSIRKTNAVTRAERYAAVTHKLYDGWHATSSPNSWTAGPFKTHLEAFRAFLNRD